MVGLSVAVIPSTLEPPVEFLAEQDLVRSYREGSLGPTSLGRAFLSHRERFGVTAQQLSRRTGITAGTIHHYESVVLDLAPDLSASVDRGVLSFKEARAIADLPTHDRQRDIAQPFLSGRLSSVHVEKVVALAKRRPELDVEEVIRQAISGTTAARTVPPPIEQRQPVKVTVTDLECQIVQVAGLLDAATLGQIPECYALRLRSRLQLLLEKGHRLAQALSPTKAA